jgi:hypothetical protein
LPKKKGAIMARTSTKAPAIEAKALSASSKSEGMRILYDDGYTVAQVARVFGIGYAFAYGVAKRHGVVDTAAERRVPKAKVPAKAATTKAAAAKPIRPTKGEVEKVVSPAKRVIKAGAAPAPKVTGLATGKPVGRPRKDGLPAGSPAAKKADAAKAALNGHTNGAVAPVEKLTPGQKAYRARKAKAEAAKSAPATKATVKVAVPIKAKANGTSTVAKVAAKIAGRPSPERRAANRAPHHAQA